MITTLFDALELEKKPYNPVNMTDVRRIYENSIPHVGKKAFRAPHIQQTEDQFGDIKTNLRKFTNREMKGEHH